MIERLQDLRGRRLCWGALCFGGGVGTYYGLPAEPTAPLRLAVVLGAALCILLGWMARRGFGLPFLFMASFLCGLAIAQLRTDMVAAPVLGFRYYGPVEGRVVGIDTSASGSVRLTLDRVRLDRIAPGRVPGRVRISLTEPGPWLEPRLGLRVMTTAFLSPPSGPAEPGGFDFGRHAWFQGIGAVGYGRVPLLLADTAPGPPRYVDAARMAIAGGLRDAMPGRTGQVAAAIVVGDRSGLDPTDTQALRDSNLAHLLAISGLHMGLLVGTVLGVVRLGLAAVPPVVLRVDAKAVAAIAALPFVFAYLALSGGGVATQRAAVMAVVMLGAVILNRRALSMRSVALAALIVLVLRPEALVGPGFQMSFAATGALVLAFGALSRRGGGWTRGLRGWVMALVLSSFVAGLATAPFAAAHFNRIGVYGLAANLLAVPAMGSLVMPALLLGMVLWPIGLQAWPFAAAGWGIEWILAVAHWVAALDGAVQGVVSPSPWVLPLLGLGFGALACSRGGWGRPAGGVLLAHAFAIWILTERPAVLVAESGRLAGVMTPQGRALSHATGEGFVAGIWTENDGDPTTQAIAAARPVPLSHPGLPPIVVARGKRALAEALDGCGRGIWIVTDVPLDERPTTDCVVLGPEDMRRTGSLALWPGEAGPILVAAKDIRGSRPWSDGGR
nr:ComEC/Rec2 family competence protein [Jannaschia sp. LMIT008]